MGLFSSIASIFGGGGEKQASRQAQQATIDALNKGISSISGQNSLTQAQLSPFINSGTGALSQIDALLGISTPATAGAADWNTYLQNNPDIQATYNSLSAADKARFPTAQDYAQYQYSTYGQNEGRTLPTTGGTTAIDGTTAQQTAIDQLKASPLYQSLFRNGQEAVLQNASATGGLRGGNVERSLANFGSDTLSSVIQQQLQNLGGVSGAGLTALQTGANSGSNAASSIASLYGQQGQATSNGILTRAGITAGQINGLGGLADSLGSAIAGGGSIGSIAKSLF